MALMEGNYHALNGEDSKLVKSRRWVNWGIALLSAACLTLLSTSMVGASGGASIFGRTGNFLVSSAKDPATNLAVKRPASYFTQADTAKKQAPADPIEEKIATVCKALKNNEYDVNCRDMLLQTAPYALRDAKDKRHEWYHNVVNMVGEVFTSQDKRMQERLAEKQSVVDNADTRIRNLESQKSDIESKLQANQADLDVKRANKDTNQALLTENEEKLKQTMEELTNEKAFFSSLVADKDRKQGVWQNSKDQISHTLATKDLLNDISMPKSMSVAVPFALYQKPAARNFFDNITVAQLDKMVATHLSNLDQQILDTNQDMAVKEAKTVEATAAVESARQQLRASSEMVETQESARAGLELELRELKKAMKDHGPAVRQAGDMLQRENSDLGTLHNIMDQFAELRDRETVTPQPEMAMEAATTAISGEASVMPGEAEVTQTEVQPTSGDVQPTSGDVAMPAQVQTMPGEAKDAARETTRSEMAMEATTGESQVKPSEEQAKLSEVQPTLGEVAMQAKEQATPGEVKAADMAVEATEVQQKGEGQAQAGGEGEGMLKAPSVSPVMEQQPLRQQQQDAQVPQPVVVMEQQPPQQQQQGAQVPQPMVVATPQLVSALAQSMQRVPAASAA